MPEVAEITFGNVRREWKGAELGHGILCGVCLHPIFFGNSDCRKGYRVEVGFVHERCLQEWENLRKGFRP